MLQVFNMQLLVFFHLEEQPVTYFVKPASLSQKGNGRLERSRQTEGERACKEGWYPEFSQTRRGLRAKRWVGINKTEICERQSVQRLPKKSTFSL